MIIIIIIIIENLTQLHVPLCGHRRRRAEVQQPLYSLPQHCQRKGEWESFFAQYHQQLTSPITWAEKVFLFLWFWFFGLTILTGMHLVFRLTCITIPPLRCSTFLSLSFHSLQFVSRSMLLLGRARAFTHSDLATCRQVF